MAQNDTVQRRTWVAACSHRLQRQWPSIDPQQVEELAASLWQDERLRRLEPTDAAAEWLQPITSATADPARCHRAGG